MLPTLRLIKVANPPFMTVSKQLPLRLSKMQDNKSLSLHWRLYPGWGGKYVSLLIDFTGGLEIQNKQWPAIVNILRPTVTYFTGTINRTIWKTELGIGPTQSTQTLQHPWVHRCETEFGQSRTSGFGLDWSATQPNWYYTWNLDHSQFSASIANTTLDSSLRH